jgi:hypothetical protein
MQNHSGPTQLFPNPVREERTPVMRSDHHRLDVWSLMDVYRGTFEIICEANLQFPFALAKMWGLSPRG